MSTEPHDETVLGKAYDARLVRRLLEHVLPETGLIALSVALMFVVMAAQLAQPYLLKLVIDGPVHHGNPSGLAPLALFYLLAFVVELTARFGQLYSMERTGQKVILSLRNRLFAHLQGLDSAFFDRYPVGRLMTRVTTDVESLADLFSSGIVILCWLDMRLALVTFAIAPVLFLLSALYRGRIRQAYRNVRLRVARLNGFLQEAISGMLVVQLFRRQSEDLRDFEAINREHREAELQSVVYESSFSAVIELVGTLATALIIWYGGGRLATGALTFGTLVAFLEYASRFFGPIRDLSSFYAVLQAAMASLERIFALLDTRPAITSPDLPVPAGRARGLVEFEAVEFSYRAGAPVLHGIGFRVEPGQRVAVVGATGAGKTSRPPARYAWTGRICDSGRWRPSGGRSAWSCRIMS